VEWNYEVMEETGNSKRGLLVRLTVNLQFQVPEKVHFYTGSFTPWKFFHWVSDIPSLVCYVRMLLKNMSVNIHNIAFSFILIPPPSFHQLLVASWEHRIPTALDIVRGVA